VFFLFYFQQGPAWFGSPSLQHSPNDPIFVLLLQHGGEWGSVLQMMHGGA